MLKKEFRLSKRKDFEEIKAKGKLKNGELFSVIYIKTLGSTDTPLEEGGQDKKSSLKVAIVVSKKISKKAVDRNLIRRKMYRIIGDNMEDFPKNFAGIFLVKKSILGKSEEEMKKCLKTLF